MEQLIDNRERLLVRHAQAEVVEDGRVVVARDGGKVGRHAGGDHIRPLEQTGDAHAAFEGG